MSGFLIGSALLTWVLCSALNSAIEWAAIKGVINRGRAFVIMLAGVLMIGALMAALALWGFPQSTLATQKLSADQLNTAVISSCLLNLFVAFGYCSLQLRRFWSEE